MDLDRRPRLALREWHTDRLRREPHHVATGVEPRTTIQFGMRSHPAIVGLVALAAALATGCALSHEAAIDTGIDDAWIDFDASLDGTTRRDVFPGEIVARPDVIVAPDAGCAAGMMRCGSGGCVDVSSDTSNCGACGTTCPGPSNGTAVCSMGICHVNCAGGYHLCGAACVPDASTAQCGNACLPCMAVPNADVACVGGGCMHTCVAGFVDNGGSCVSTSPLTCGDRTLETGETCDDGNRVGGDGCSPSCQMEPGTSADDCSTTIVPIRISDTGRHLYVGTTNGASSSASSCVADGPDVAYQIVYESPLSSYSYAVTAVPSTRWDVVLEHGGVCSPGTCVDVYAAGGTESYSNTPSGPVTTFVMVDGYHSGDHGDFVLEIDVM